MKKTVFLVALTTLLFAGCSSSELELFVVSGNAMEPTFVDGARLLVDTSSREYFVEDVVIYTNDNGNIILGRVVGIHENIYEIAPDNAELELNIHEYLPTEAKDIIGAAFLCHKGRFKCWIETFSSGSRF
jgi:phage repressor protein C with HTH and peptisase S24 domain